MLSLHVSLLVFPPQKHMHLDARLMWCRICSEGFINEYNLVNHMAKKHFESELPYRCEVCNFVTSILYSLIDHFNTVSGGDERDTLVLWWCGSL